MYNQPIPHVKINKFLREKDIPIYNHLKKLQQQNIQKIKQKLSPKKQLYFYYGNHNQYDDNITHLHNEYTKHIESLNKNITFLKYNLNEVITKKNNLTKANNYLNDQLVKCYQQISELTQNNKTLENKLKQQQTYIQQLTNTNKFVAKLNKQLLYNKNFKEKFFQDNILNTTNLTKYPNQSLNQSSYF